MENTAPDKKDNWENGPQKALLALGIVFLFFILYSLFSETNPKTRQSTASNLINTKEIANLSVTRFVYNGIARTYKENGDHDYNVLYKSTVNVSIDADGIGYAVDEDQKKVMFIFPEFKIENPLIDISSISTIPDRNDLYPDELIKLCKTTAFEEASKSEKLISSAQENLKSIIEAWYSPVFEGYTFEYQFGVTEGGETK